MIKPIYLVTLLVVLKGVSGQYRVCYYNASAALLKQRSSQAAMTPDKIDPFLCTHIIYLSAKISTVGVLTTSAITVNAYELQPKYDKTSETTPATGTYALFNGLKTTNPLLKTLLSVGGWDFGTQIFSSLIKEVSNMTYFTQSAIKFLRQYNFDGLDIDMEFPGSRGSPATDKQQFTVFIQETMAAFQDEARNTGKPQLLLTAAVSALKPTIDAGYEIPDICSVLDFINLMSFDFHGSWDLVTGINSPFQAHPNETGSKATMNFKWAANYWVSGGCPRNKIVVGVPTYGRTFSLTLSNNHGWGAPASGAAGIGSYTKLIGVYAYFEICNMLQPTGPAVYVWLTEQMVPYAYTGANATPSQMWVGFEDVHSVGLKVDWIKSRNFAGFMVWTLDLDDFNGDFCKQGKYPLLTKMYNVYLSPPPSSSA